MFTIKNILNFILLFTFLLLVCSCDAVESNESGTLHIKYTGVEEGEYGTVATFLMGNDTTETISYLAYGEESPHYSTEVLTDSGWTYLMWNWCGTGTTPVDLKPGAKTKFTTALPDYECTWRVVLGISVVGSDKYYTLKSDKIDHLVSK